ncbi:MAG: T9SS type A sorting domain-containing protein [Candidatus Stahlbacteria bacterium]|nr:T9SS type A sorting domain-containing protein [Candidatus Stahlbacteria bacterium]
MKKVYVIILLCVFSSANAQQNLQGWHTQGQTFLIWEHSESVPSDTTYEIYHSLQPITSISNATWIGKVFANNGANTRLNDCVSDARWKLPDTSKGTVTVDTDEAYFVVTPYTSNNSYYAVVLSGDTSISSENTIGPVLETIGFISCVIQYQDAVVTIYAHWIDGRRDYDAGLPEYPVMGNEYSNGLGFNFAIWKRGTSTVNLPLVIALHGGGSNLIQEGLFRYSLVSGFFVALDDGISVRDSIGSEIVEGNTFWTGYANTYNRFTLLYPNDSAIVVNYTARRVWWEVEWLKNNLPVDTTRISLTGISMGGVGTLLHSQLRADLFSAGLSYVPLLRGIKVLNDQYRIYPIFGTPTQNLATNFDGATGIYDILDEEWRLQLFSTDWPFTIIASGKNDTNATWAEKPDLYRKLDSAKTGFALYWDEREHINWVGAHFRFSEHINLSYLTRFRKNQSFPAFSGTDLDLVTPGRQPDPGNGIPVNGDVWGTWGGYLEWDTESIVDTINRWAVTMWVVFQSSYPNDIPEADTILANVTPRRLQQLQPQPGHTYSWNLVKVSNGDTLQEGIVETDSSNLITVLELLLIKEPVRLTIYESVAVEEITNSKIQDVKLEAYPNPFIQKTVIEFRVQSSELKDTQLQIYDLAGRVVKTFLITNTITKVVWDGKDDLGESVRSGVYFVKLSRRLSGSASGGKTGKFSQIKGNPKSRYVGTQKLLLLRK